jgi:2-polyprenyl-3-methyl-5-hydroxy-6-metoxy-1,4-benzoquinol methylase
MNRVDYIRSEEKKYHEACYDDYKLFQLGTWLHKPVKTVIDLIDCFNDRSELSVLDLGSGVGRNSIPIAKSLKHRYGKVVCVDLLDSALDKLKKYSEEFDVQQYIKAIQSDVETFEIQQEEFDFIVAVSVLEHLRSKNVLERKLHEMAVGTRPNGINCIIINSNVREVDLETKKDLDPMFEVNISTEEMIDLLEYQYEGWKVDTKIVKYLEFDIERSGRPVKLMTDCVTFVARKM